MQYSEKKIALVDIDGTLLSGQSQVHLVFYLYSKRLISTLVFLKVLIWYLRYKYFSAKINSQMTERIYSLILTDRDEKEVGKIIDDFFKNKLTKKIYKKSDKFINKLKENNYIIILVSASIYPICIRVKDYFHADYLICTDLEIKGGKYTGHIMEGINEGLEKKRRILQYLNERSLNLAGSIGVGDRMSDIDMLGLTENAIVVNPESRLQKYAVKHGWKVISL